METIKVNMSPNPLDVQTIHASQNDSEAREWGFELHNNGDAIDSSSISDQLVFKSYKGGTEQILPENGAVPVTAPFVGDIKYPDATRTNQEFLYRQSPTEEDGLAKITDIKGNTLVWNQLVQNGNFESASGWSPNIQANTITTSSNELTVNINTLGNNVGVYSTRLLHNRIANHKYLFKLNVYVPHATTVRFGTENEIQRNIIAGWNTVYGIVQSSITSKVIVCYISATEALSFASGETYKIKNYQCFDLTQIGLDSITSVDEFTSLFSLPYYSYNQGSLLSFNGNGIKTTGKNLVYKILEKVNIGSNGELFTDEQELYDIAVASVVAGNKYIITPHAPVQIMGYFTVDPVVGNRTYNNSRITDGADIFTAEISGYVAFRLERTKYEYAQLEIGVTRTSYEEYVSNTTDLLISQYFPTGMKSAGTAYDELTPIKAITRIGAVDLGTITYTYDGECFIGKLPSDAKVLGANTETLNSVSDRYLINNWSSVKYLKSNMTLGTGVSRYICIFNNSYTDATAFKTAMSGVYLYYELATPTETSFTTASLVTENAEIPLSNEDGVLIGKCTEQLSENPGFIDAKIKLSDGDGECYSNKIQLHVERSPQ